MASAPSEGVFSARLTVMLGPGAGCRGKGRFMALAFKFEEITARELKPQLLELDGISRESVEAHYKLYQGYVAKRNEILAALDGVDLSAPNQVYSEVRALKVELSFAVGGIKNHEIYFEHLGGDGGDPDGPVAALIKRDFGTIKDWHDDLKATGMAARGWAWTAYDWDEGRLFNYLGDAQNTYPIWNATPLVALDVYEHAYFLDYQTDRLPHRRPPLRRAGGAARRREGLRADPARDDLCRPPRRRADRCGGDARPRSAALPPLREGRQDGGDLRRRLLGTRAVRGPRGLGRLDRGLPRVPLRVDRLDPLGALAARRLRRDRRAVAGDGLRLRGG